MYMHIYVYIENNNNTDCFRSASTEFGQPLAMLVTIVVREHNCHSCPSQPAKITRYGYTLISVDVYKWHFNDDV